MTDPALTDEPLIDRKRPRDSRSSAVRFMMSRALLSGRNAQRIWPISLARQSRRQRCARMEDGGASWARGVRGEGPIGTLSQRPNDEMAEGEVARLSRGGTRLPSLAAL